MPWLGTTFLVGGGLVLAGVSAPFVIGIGTVAGIAAGLGYDFGGYGDDVKDLYKEYGEPYYQKHFGDN